MVDIAAALVEFGGDPAALRLLDNDGPVWPGWTHPVDAVHPKRCYLI